MLSEHGRIELALERLRMDQGLRRTALSSAEQLLPFKGAPTAGDVTNLLADAKSIHDWLNEGATP